MRLGQRVFKIFRRSLEKKGDKFQYRWGYLSAKLRLVAIERYKVKKGNLLEVGCGDGFLLFSLAKENRNLKLFGLDRDRGLLDEARERQERERADIKLICAEAKSLPFLDGYFDSVVCINTLLNFPSLDYTIQAIKEMMRVCKSGGKIIFDLRNSQNPFIYLGYRWVRFYEHTISRPMKTYRPDKILNILKEMRNLKVVDQIPVGVGLKAFAPIILIESVKV